MHTTCISGAILTVARANRSQYDDFKGSEESPYVHTTGTKKC